MEPRDCVGPALARPRDAHEVVPPRLIAVDRRGVAVRRLRPDVPVRTDRHGRAPVAEVPRLARGLREERPHLEGYRVTRTDAGSRRVAGVDRGRGLALERLVDDQ